LVSTGWTFHFDIHPFNKTLDMEDMFTRGFHDLVSEVGNSPEIGMFIKKR